MATGRGGMCETDAAEQESSEQLSTLLLGLGIFLLGVHAGRVRICKPFVSCHATSTLAEGNTLNTTLLYVPFHASSNLKYHH